MMLVHLFLALILATLIFMVMMVMMMMMPDAWLNLSGQSLSLILLISLYVMLMLVNVHIRYQSYTTIQDGLVFLPVCCFSKFPLNLDDSILVMLYLIESKNTRMRLL